MKRRQFSRSIVQRHRELIEELGYCAALCERGHDQVNTQDIPAYLDMQRAAAKRAGFKGDIAELLRVAADHIRATGTEMARQEAATLLRFHFEHINDKISGRNVKASDDGDLVKPITLVVRGKKATAMIAAAKRRIYTQLFREKTGWPWRSGQTVFMTGGENLGAVKKWFREKSALDGALLAYEHDLVTYIMMVCSHGEAKSALRAIEYGWWPGGTTGHM